MKLKTSRKKVFPFILCTLTVLILLSTLAIWHISNENKTPLNAFLETYHLDGMNIKQVIQKLEVIADEEEGFQAGITGSYLLLSDRDESYSIELPSGEFYISIAPYMNQTHPCGNHNLVTCRGEMKLETFHVNIVDIDSNEVVIDASYQSTAQGFFGIWLKQDKNYMIHITYGDLSTSTTIQTRSDSNTCLTTMKLT